jgi:hypothetical protein
VPVLRHLIAPKSPRPNIRTLRLPADAAAVVLVKSIISLAHCFKMQIVAAGVESEEQAKCLAPMGCEQIQGSIISMPKAFDEITSYFKGDRADTDFALRPNGTVSLLPGLADLRSACGPPANHRAGGR